MSEYLYETMAYLPNDDMLPVPFLVEDQQTDDDTQVFSSDISEMSDFHGSRPQRATMAPSKDDSNGNRTTPVWGGIHPALAVADICPSGKVMGPENYKGSQDLFMRGEAYLAPHRREALKAKDCDMSSTWVAFEDREVTISVAGFFGCTGVVAVSRRGAWAAHFFEEPSFDGTERYEDPEGYGEPEGYGNDEAGTIDQETRFQHDVLDRLHGPYRGAGTANEFRAGYYHQLGLAQLRNNDDLNASHTGHIMDDDAEPRVYIFAPRPLTAPSARYDGKGSPGDFGAFAGEGELRYEYETLEIWGEVQSIFGWSEKEAKKRIEIVEYSPLNLDWVDEHGHWSSLPGGDKGDPECTTSRGKILLQYEPAWFPGGNAMNRVWFEARPLDDRQDVWVADPEQVYDMAQPKFIGDEMPRHLEPVMRRMGIQYFWYSRPAGVEEGMGTMAFSRVAAEGGHKEDMRRVDITIEECFEDETPDVEMEIKMQSLTISDCQREQKRNGQGVIGGATGCSKRKRED